MMIRLATFLLLAATTTAAAQPLPQPKVGVCPSGYMQSGENELMRPAA
jgi:hypothetical protein